MPLFKNWFRLPERGSLPAVDRMKTQHDAPGLAKVLAGPFSSSVRLEALRALVELDDERGVPAIVEALHDPYPDIRSAAGKALQQMQTPAARAAQINAWLESGDWQSCAKAGLPAVAGLTRALFNPHEAYRQAAYQALVSIGAPAVPGLLRVFEGYACSASSLVEMILVEIGEPAFEPLLEALEDKNSRVRLSSASALGRLGNPRAVQPLKKLLKDRNLQVRQAAALALAHLGNAQAASVINEQNPREKTVER